MNLAEAQAQVAAATSAAAQQIELNKTSFANQLDNADRIVMQMSALAAIEMAKRPEPMSPPV